MAGYQYRPTPARARAAEAMMRTIPTPNLDPGPELSEVPAPAVPVVTRGGDVFEVVKETPRPPRRQKRKSTMRVAAASAVKVLEESPGEWFRVAKRGTKSKAYSYTATLRTVTDKPVQTRIVDEDDAFIVYARIKAKEAKK